MTGDRWDAPFTADQIAVLERWQDCGVVHPYTCGGDHDTEHKLIPLTCGWVCPDPSCVYSQTWAHDHVAKGWDPASWGSPE
jgi:hypothetical protein